MWIHASTEGMHSKWHMVADYNGVRKHRAVQSPHAGRPLGFPASSLPKSCLIDESNLSFRTFTNEPLRTLNSTYWGETHFPELNLVDEYASGIKCPRCLANLNYNKSKYSDKFSQIAVPAHRSTPSIFAVDTANPNASLKRTRRPARSWLNTFALSSGAHRPPKNMLIWGARLGESPGYLTALESRGSCEWDARLIV